MAPGRNAPCPCGSGKKYKRCHGALNAAPEPPKRMPYVDPAQVRRIYAGLEARRIQTERQQGLGKGIISAELKGHRIVAVGNTIHSSDKWKTFHDFLADYIKQVFGREWWFSWVDKSRDQLHPVLLWAHMVHEQQIAAGASPGTVNEIRATGAMSAYLSLAYDLYCLAHNVELQKRLVDRLKNPEQFWGARYEVFVAASLLRAGFDVKFENEDDRSSTHCEFTATHKQTKRSFSVEAKHRAGNQFRFGRQLNRALKKTANHERLVFIDINVPNAGSDSEQVREALLRAVRDVRPFENRAINGSLLPPAYLVISNSPHHHHLASSTYQGAALLEGFRIPDFKHDVTYPSLRAAVESKERHRELHDLGQSMIDHSAIPSTFDGEIPEFAFGRTARRWTIGQLYEVPYGDRMRIGRLTTATVAEEEKKVHCAYHFEDTDEAIVVTHPMSDAELSAWRRHSDTFFGVPSQRSTKARDPVELYEFFLRTYRQSSKEKLLEFLKEAPDFVELVQLDQPALAREYCLRMASTVHAQSNEAAMRRESA